MKKNISINISGIIFHIEEDAYEQLREYLQKINRYFSSFEDNEEIVADIEGRIAEIFLSKLSEEKQVITSEDVSNLITTMGDVKDFQAMEEEPIAGERHQEYQEDSGTTYHETETRRLFRDENHKLIGGVCAGLGHYFSVDPVWIRLLALILVWGYGVGLLAYVVLWIVLPGSQSIPAYKNSKKFYRDPDDRVLGGVSAGLGAYFGVDSIVFRLLFVILTIAGGVGLVLYLILWVATPEAHTISEKVQMSGDPVTLSNIESSIKKNLNIDERKPEDPVTKILLFPFRLIAAIVNGIARILGPVLLFLVDAIRVIAGVILCFFGISVILGLLFAVGALFGIFTGGPFVDHPFWLHEIGIPWDVISDSFPFVTTAALFIALLVPGIIFLLLGVSVIVKRLVFGAAAGWSIFALFIISVVILSINIPAIVYQFREDGRVDVTENFDLKGKTPVLTLHEVGMEDYDVVHLRLAGHDDSTYQLSKTFYAQGNSRKDAMDNARMTTYDVALRDSVFVFDSNLKFLPDARFRGQHVNVTLYMPYNTPFVIDYEMRYLLSQFYYDLDYNEYKEARWIIDPEDGLVCSTCPKRSSTWDNDDITSFYEGEDYDSARDIQSFNQLFIDGPLTVSIYKGRDHKLLIPGDSSTKDFSMELENDELTFHGTKPGRLVIFTPSLEKLTLDGQVKVLMTDFQQDHLEISMDGESELTAEMDIQDLALHQEDRSRLMIKGSGNFMEAELRGFSELKAADFTCNEINIEAKGKSTASIYANHAINADKSIGSEITHEGRGRYNEE